MTAPRRPLLVPHVVVDALVAVEQARSPCWRLRKYLGSMLTLEFGSRISGEDEGGRFEYGSSGVGVRDCQWVFVHGGDRIASSDDVDDSRLELIRSAIYGSALIECKPHKKRMIFGFSNSAYLSLDLTNRYGAEPDEAIASLKLEGGGFFELGVDGGFRLVHSASARPDVELAA